MGDFVVILGLSFVFLSLFVFVAFVVFIVVLDFLSPGGRKIRDTCKELHRAIDANDGEWNYEIKDGVRLDGKTIKTVEWISFSTPFCEICISDLAGYDLETSTKLEFSIKRGSYVKQDDLLGGERMVFSGLNYNLSPTSILDRYYRKKFKDTMLKYADALVQVKSL